MGKQLTREKFLLNIEKAKIIHKNKYDYTLANYTNNRTKILIKCPIHGDFTQLLYSHLQGFGCAKCAGCAKSSVDDFISLALIIHKNEYDYSLVNYKNRHTKVKIICPIHGEFEQTPANHLKGQNCPKCTGRYKTTTEYIQEVKKIHGNRYDYSKVDYNGVDFKITIVCPIHGEFEQGAGLHRNGSGCTKCGGVYQLNSKQFIEELKIIHSDKYDYSKVDYKNGHSKIKIICPIHGEFEQEAKSHKKGAGCPKCIGRNKTTEEFIIKAKQTVKYGFDYSLVRYTNNNTKVKIICPIHGEFEQTPANHLKGQNCPKCTGRYKTTTEYIQEVKKIHGNRYDYSKVKYSKCNSKIKIICPIHSEFEQTPSNHLSGQGCPACGNGFTKKYKLNLINSLEYSDLLTMDPFEIYTIIGQGKLPTDFGNLANTEPESNERITTLQELRDRFNNESTEISEDEITESEIDLNQELVQIDAVDDEVTGNSSSPNRLLSIQPITDLHSLDNSLYATMDEEAFESLIQYKLRKLWNNVLNNNVSINNIKNETGGKYFTTIKDLFLDEYFQVEQYKQPQGYSFKYQPNLMQKLTVHRLLKNKSYGNWSGTGAGKTLSFIIASREVDSRLTIVIALNSTIKQTCKSIKEVYKDSLIFTDYKLDFKFDRNKHNYLVLNYEKFQQANSEELFQNLTNNNHIDFVVIDEVHNAKQRDEEEESIRRSVLNRLLGRIRENNSNLYTLAMSATPVINNLYEAKSLLMLLTGLDYNDLNNRRTLPNALKVFQQLILNGLRYIPKYDIDITEFTGSNMSNLNIDGQHLLDRLIQLEPSQFVECEKLLLDDKLKAITPYLRKGAILYTYFTTGFVDTIKDYITNLGFKVGTYTGEESLGIREQNLKKFQSGEIDILIGSKPIGTGVDGLQDICDRMIVITLPWTDSEYTQLKGRIYRQGSKFADVEIIIPQVRIVTGDNEVWSWDIQRLNLIKNKKTLADAAVDGVVPSRILPSPSTLFSKSQESLTNWKDRINAGNIIEDTRQKLSFELYPEIQDDIERERRILSELSEFNRRGKITTSERMHKEFIDNPASWFRYHKLRNERMDKWDEIPYEYIATKIKNRNHKIVDFGCGENRFKDCIPNNQVISFDHVACDDSVIACDMKDVSSYLKNESVDVAVFSLALWGTNYKDYIQEAYRVLNYGGVIHIAEPAKDYETEETLAKVSNLIMEIGFKVIGNIETRGKFIYITGFKE